jgi:hypothetical protein
MISRGRPLAIVDRQALLPAEICLRLPMLGDELPYRAVHHVAKSGHRVRAAANSPHVLEHVAHRTAVVSNQSRKRTELQRFGARQMKGLRPQRHTRIGSGSIRCRAGRVATGSLEFSFGAGRFRRPQGARSTLGVRLLVRPASLFSRSPGSRRENGEGFLRLFTSVESVSCRSARVSAT